MNFDVDRWLRILGFIAFMFRLIVEALRYSKKYLAERDTPTVPPGLPKG